MSDPVLLDTSAIFALIDDEEGADTVEDYLNAARKGKVRLFGSFVSLIEVRYIVIQERDEPSADYLVGLLKSWPIQLIYPDERECLLAARFKAQYRISLADAMVAAAAYMLKAILVHKDPEFNQLSQDIRLLALPHRRKKAVRNSRKP